MAFLTGYTKRKKITIDNTKVDSTLTDFPVRVYLNADTDIGAVSNADGFDIRFTSSDGETLLKYEREDFAISGGAATGNFWVKVPSVSSSADTEIYIYYRAEDTADGADPTNVWDSNFKTVHHLKDATTSTVLDSTSNDNDGTKKGANEPVEADAKIGKGQEFDGSDDFIGISPANLGAGKVFSISGLFYIDTDTSTRNIIGGGTTDKYSPTVQYFHTNKNIRVVSNGSNNYTVTANNSIIKQTWYFFTYTVNDKTNKIYLNDSASVDSTETNSPSNWDATIFIGKRATENFFDGKIDEIRISNVVRSDAWIKADYNSCFNTLLSLGAEETGSSGLNMQVKIGSAWKNVSSAQVKIGNDWKNVSGVQIKIGNNWKNI